LFYSLSRQEDLELTRFGGHLTVPDTEVFSEWIIEQA
jgi:hypothetical protein